MPLHEPDTQKPQILDHPDAVDALCHYARTGFFGYLHQLAYSWSTCRLVEIPDEALVQIDVIRREIAGGLKRISARADTGAAQGKSKSTLS